MYRSLNAEHIIRTIEQLRVRIEERFPGSGLSKVAEELQHIGHEAVTRARWIARPLLGLRVLQQVRRRDRDDPEAGMCDVLTVVEPEEGALLTEQAREAQQAEEQ